MSVIYVTREEVVRFLESAFRNIELPPLCDRDVADIQQGLADLLARRLSVLSATGSEKNDG